MNRRHFTKRSPAIICRERSLWNERKFIRLAAISETVATRKVGLSIPNDWRGDSKLFFPLFRKEWLRGRLGSLFRTTGGRTEIVFIRYRAPRHAVGPATSRGAAGGRFWNSHHGLDAAAGHRLHAGAHCRGRTRRRVGDRPLHYLSRAGRFVYARRH